MYTNPGDDERDEKQHGALGICPRCRRGFAGGVVSTEILAGCAAGAAGGSWREDFRHAEAGADGHTIRIVTVKVLALLAEGRRRIVARVLGRFDADVHFRRFGALERVFDSRCGALLGQVAELLSLLEDFFSGADVNGECNENDQPGIVGLDRHERIL